MLLAFLQTNGEIKAKIRKENITLKSNMNWVICTFINCELLKKQLMYISLFYILKTPNVVSGIGAFNAALKLSPRTFLVSLGSIIPSSHNLSLTHWIIFMRINQMKFMKHRDSQLIIVFTLHWKSKDFLQIQSVQWLVASEPFPLPKWTIFRKPIKY